jgi:thioredoxin reductase (NADPH)
MTGRPASPGEGKPVIFIVDADLVSRRGLSVDVRRRFGADYRVLTASTAAAALARLERMRAAGDGVALLLADCWAPETSGVQFLTDRLQRRRKRDGDRRFGA